MSKSVCAVVGALLSALFLCPATSQAETAAPAAWEQVGTVDVWREMDSHFYRIHGLTGSPGPQIYDFDQKSIYAKTFEHDSKYGRVTLADFGALSAAEREERFAEAGHQLKQVERFRLRMAELVMRVRGQQASVWGGRERDYTAVGDVLGRLQTAVGVDPTNAYAWHLLSYFATLAGDYDRALQSLEGADAALAAWPDSAFVPTRDRIALDRTWLLRDLGRLAAAKDSLAKVGMAPDKAREITTLRGLLAAQSGDLNEAFRVAGQLAGAEVPVFPMDWESTSTLSTAIHDPQGWPKRKSAHLQAWVLALAWLADGRKDQATKAFPEFSLDRHYQLGRHFVNDAATIYEATGRTELARKWWSMAHLYVPYQPYTVYKPYGMEVASLTGRPGALPFVLAYDTHLQAGSRLAYGMALLAQAASANVRPEQVDVARKAIGQFEICLGSNIDVPAAALGLGYAEAVIGNPFRMLQAAGRGLKALDLRPQSGTPRAALLRIRETALAVSDSLTATAGLGWGPQDSVLQPGESPADAGRRLRAARDSDPDDPKARRDLARWEIRYGNPTAGAQLAAPPPGQAKLSTEDLLLALEVDRLRNDPTRARKLLAGSEAGTNDLGADSRVWLLVGIIAEDHGLPGARRALERALALDPSNGALRSHLESTGAAVPSP